MTNQEKYTQELVDIALRGEVAALQNGKPVPCSAVRHCADCDIEIACQQDDAVRALRQWAEQEAPNG